MGVQSARRLWPIAEAMHRLGIGKSKVYQLINRGELTLVKVDNKSLITDDSIESFVAAAVTRALDTSKAESES